MKPIDLHTLRQEAFYRRAAARMAESCPGWSDEFPSDPVVAVLELASCLSDLQGGYINAVESAHYAAFLSLLGGRAAERAPAVMLARSVGPRRPWPGQRFWIDGVPYEAAAGTAEAGEIKRAVLERGGHTVPWDMSLPLSLEDGDRLCLELSEPLPAGRPARLWCGVRPEAGRTPPERDTPPPVELRADALGRDGGWMELSVEDGSRGLLQSGFWLLTPGADVRALRLAWDGSFEGRPEIETLVLEPVRLEQRHTRSAAEDLRPPFRVPEGWAGSRVLRCFLPEGEAWREAPELFIRDGLLTGWPGAAPEVIRAAAAEPDFRAVFPLRPLAGEQADLEEPGVLRDSLRLMVEEGGLWYDCPVRRPDPAQTLDRGCRWDRERDLLCFGDGRDFRVPKEGRLLVCACAATRGEGGNGAFGTFGQEETRLSALRPASGGTDRESARDAFFRAAREFSTPQRAVTCEDYEALARTTPGLALRQVRAMLRRTRGEAGVTVVAKPVSRDPLPALTQWQADLLRERLEKCRLIGVPVQVQSPRYLPVEIAASLRADASVDEAAVRRAAEQVVDGVSGPVEFGAELSYPALFSALARVEGVLAVTTLELRPLAGGARRTQDGSVRLQPDVLPYLKNLRLSWD